MNLLQTCATCKIAGTETAHCLYTGESEPGVEFTDSNLNHASSVNEESTAPDSNSKHFVEVFAMDKMAFDDTLLPQESENMPYIIDP